MIKDKDQRVIELRLYAVFGPRTANNSDADDIARHMSEVKHEGFEPFWEIPKRGLRLGLARKMHGLAHSHV
jgi:hypothetical protein